MPSLACARLRSRKAPAALAADPLATMIVMQEFGRNLVVEPFFETVVLAGGLIEDVGSPEQREAFLPDIMAGRIDMGAGLGGRALALRF